MPNHEPQSNHLNLSSVCEKSSAVLKLFRDDLGLTWGFHLSQNSWRLFWCFNFKSSEVWKQSYNKLVLNQMSSSLASVFCNCFSKLNIFSVHAFIVSQSHYSSRPTALFAGNYKATNQLTVLGMLCRHWLTLHSCLKICPRFLKRNLRRFQKSREAESLFWFWKYLRKMRFLLSGLPFACLPPARQSPSPGKNHPEVRVSCDPPENSAGLLFPKQQFLSGLTCKGMVSCQSGVIPSFKAPLE